MTSGSRIHNFVDRLEEGIMATLLAIMTLLTFIQVVLRYVFNSGWVWSLEATTYSFAWLVLLGMSYGVRTKSHIAVDLLTKKFPQPIRQYVALLAITLCVFYSGLMIYGSYDFINGLFRIGNMARDIHLPKWLLSGFMPIAFALLAYRFLQVGWHVIKDKDSDGDFGGDDAAVTLHDQPDNEQGDKT